MAQVKQKKLGIKSIWPARPPSYPCHNSTPPMGWFTLLPRLKDINIKQHNIVFAHDYTDTSIFTALLLFSSELHTISTTVTSPLPSFFQQILY